MVQAGPDTTTVESGFPWNHCSGYHSADDRFTGFSHTHLHATGVPDGGAVGSSYNIAGDRPFTEGDAIQYRWLVPHDLPGLRDALGGADKMRVALEDFFERAVPEQAQILAEPLDDLWWMTNPPKYYWHGNEPDIHAAYAFLAAGRPDLAQKWIRWIADTLYSTAVDGIPGNDDCGSLSAWWVFTLPGGTDDVTDRWT